MKIRKIMMRHFTLLSVLQEFLLKTMKVQEALLDLVKPLIFIYLQYELY